MLHIDAQPETEREILQLLKHTTFTHAPIILVEMTGAADLTALRLPSGGRPATGRTAPASVPARRKIAKRVQGLTMREHVLRVLAQAGKPLTTKDVYTAARKSRGRTNANTVYNTLRLLLLDKQVARQPTGQWVVTPQAGQRLTIAPE